MIRRRSGFTLFELLVVLVILAITATAAIPVFSTTQTGSPERRLATDIAVALTNARNSARESGRPSTFVLSPTDGRYWISTRDSSVSGVVTLANGARIKSDGRDRIECHFDPAGAASPLELTIEGNDPATITVDRWSGEVRVNGRAR